MSQLIAELTIAMLARTRIALIPFIGFGGDSPESLTSRIHACGGKIVITANRHDLGGHNEQ
jgi:acetyl-CoA synthetase